MDKIKKSITFFEKLLSKPLKPEPLYFSILILLIVRYFERQYCDI